MNRHEQCVRPVESSVRLRHLFKHAPYYIRRYLILPSETEADRLIALVHIVMNSYPYHIGIAHILQHMIEQDVQAIYKVCNMIR